MARHHPKNERIKYEYFNHVRHSTGASEATIDAIAKSLARFEVDMKYRDFRKFRKEQAIAFKERLIDQRS